jgi:hypothetical protein
LLNREVTLKFCESHSTPSDRAGLQESVCETLMIQGAGWKGVSLSLTVLNALNRNPPFVDAAGLFNVNYDPSNASPLGRFLALTVNKKW